jgi:DNA-binding NarL/FixJ family response regulator
MIVMTWILNPVVQLALTAAGMLACLALFIAVKRENCELRRRLRLQQEELDGRVESFRHSLERMMESIETAENTPAPAAPAIAPGISMNLNKRSQALRMYRRGEPTERIAAALQLSRNEVDLILKVHRTVVEQA